MGPKTLSQAPVSEGWMLLFQNEFEEDSTVNHTSDKGPLSRIYKEPQQPNDNSKKTQF